MRRYQYKRAYTWSPNIAYSVGLMTSDGCLQKDGRHLDITSIDIEQIKNFSRALGRNLTISTKRSGSDSLAYRTQFSDVAYYDFLLRVGLTPVKSKTISKLDIPEKWYADFLRGVFDGDGSCYSYTDNRWRSSYMFYTTFTSASLAFLEYIQSSNRLVIGVGCGTLRKSGRAYSLAYAKADSHKLKAYMYHSPEVLSLARKRNKLGKFVETDQAWYNNLVRARVVKLVNTQP